MPKLFSELTIRNIKFKNRVGVSPMCQYSANNGFPSDWHLVHLGSRAIGGVGFVIQEATAVSPEGRISPEDLGIWNDKQTESYKIITDFIISSDSIPCIQLAHAGRKASTYAPFRGIGTVTIENGGWQPIAPSSEAFDAKSPVPKEMTKDDIEKTIDDFKNAAKRSIDAGYKAIELHFAHGYLAHQFLSPLSNKRYDEYGGSFENRIRFPLEIVKQVRKTIPDGIPLFARISCTDWGNDGWNLEESIDFAKHLKQEGVDLIDCSSGGNISNVKIPVAPLYQVPFAQKIKEEANILTAAVGLITTPDEASEIIKDEKADFVLIGREMLRNPYWCINAAKKLDEKIPIPKQYLRAF